MKFLTSILFLAAALTACQSNSREDGSEEMNREETKDTGTSMSSEQKGEKQYDSVHYGEKIHEQNAMPLTQLLDSMGNKPEYQAKVKGQVSAVCQKKGCWMKLNRPDGKSMRVTFKDYGFFVPMDLSGQKVVMQGRAYLDTIPVKHRRHFARDAGKSEEEIKKIKEPKVQIAFKANGVKIMQ